MWKVNLILLTGLLTIGFTSGYFPPPKHNQEAFIDENGKQMGPQFLEAEMQKLWDKHTIHRPRSGHPDSRAMAPQFKTTARFNGTTIVGKTMMTNRDEREIYAWEGFRYGKPIDRKTRFKPAIREDNVWWDGDTFYADKMGFKCPQEPMIGHTPAGRADCLYLNIFTPYIPTTVNATGLPVMFFVHGGGFVMGDTSMYLPTKLLNHDVILVTIHYRLGAQGFWSLDNDDAPGNMALSDQVLALQWVHDNIEEFGGNPNKITIFGESAGSVSVNYLMLTEQTKGLISGVIAESGSALDNWAIDLDPRYAAFFIAEYVGCNTTGRTDKEIFDCVLEVPDADLVKAESALVVDDRHQGLVGFRGAAPIIQSMTGNPEHDDKVVVTKHPKEYLLANDYNQVPFMTGANKNEGSYVFSIMYFDYILYNNLLENTLWLKEESIQQLLKGININDDTYLTSNLMADKYCPNIDRSDFNESIPCMIDLNGALFLKAGSWQVCKYHSYYTQNLTFYYSFDFESEDTMYNWIGGKVYWDTGVTHSDELMYLFSMPFTMEGEQIDMERKMTLMWTNFATYGDPTPDSQEATWKGLNIPKWWAYEYDNPHYMLIENELVVQQEYADRWTISMDEIYGLPMPTTLQPEGPQNCDDIQKKSDAYEATMIVFIVAFVLACAGAVYYFFKARR